MSMFSDIQSKDNSIVNTDFKIEHRKWSKIFPTLVRPTFEEKITILQLAIYIFAKKQTENVQYQIVGLTGQI